MHGYKVIIVIIDGNILKNKEFDFPSYTIQSYIKKLMPSLTCTPAASGHALLPSMPVFESHIVKGLEYEPSTSYNDLIH